MKITKNRTPKNKRRIPRRIIRDVQFTNNDKRFAEHYIRDYQNKIGGFIPGQYPNYRLNNIHGRRRPSAWNEDEDCVGQEDAITLAPIYSGRGFRLEAENRCYDVASLAEMRRLNNPLVGPMTRNPFTPNDIRRIDEYMNIHPNVRATGGQKRKTYKKRKTRKTRKSMRGKRTNKNRKTRTRK